MKRLVVHLCFVVVAMVVGTTAAHAFVEPPTLISSTLQAGEALQLRIRAGECDAFREGVPGYPKISRNGSVVRVVLAMAHDDDFMLCNAYPYTLNLSLGTFPPGNYTLQVDRYYEDILQGSIFDSLGTLPFLVEGSATAIPTLSRGVQVVFALLLIGLSAQFLRRKRGLALSAVALNGLFFCGAAMAFVDSPTVAPSAPIAGQPIFVNIRAGECDGFHFDEPGLPSVTRNGSHIRLLVAAFHSDYEPYCNAPAYVLSTPIGALDAGTYTVQVDRTYEGLPGAIVETLGTLEITVAAPSMVPTLSVAFGVGLMILLVTAGVIQGRRSTHGGARGYVGARG